MLHNIKDFLCPLAEEAGAILMRYFFRAHKVERKQNAGIVTEADIASERHILRKILSFFPESSIITEESGEIQRQKSSLCWIVDPLDGTSNYAHGFPWFCVSIGLHEEGKPKAGVIYHPVLREMFYVEAGKGVWLNKKRIKVSRTSAVDECLLGTGFYYARGESLRREVELFRLLNEVALGVRRPGSAALDLAYVASGRYDGFWERGLSAWDVSAGALMVVEAGGMVTDYRGRKVTAFGQEILATNGRVHGKIIGLLRKGERLFNRNCG